MDFASAQVIGAGLAAIGVGAAAIGVGNVFGSFLESALRNPAAADSQQGRLFIGFAAAVGGRRGRRRGGNLRAVRQAYGSQARKVRAAPSALASVSSVSSSSSVLAHLSCWSVPSRPTSSRY